MDKVAAEIENLDKEKMNKVGEEMKKNGGDYVKAFEKVEADTNINMS